MNALLCLFSLLTLLACSGRNESTQTHSADRATPPVSTSMEPPVKAESNNATPAPSGSATTWHYSRRVDQEGRTVYKASVTSPRLLEFGFPYTGGSTATLTIRKRDATTHVYIQVSNGQFNRSFQGGKASVRFDEDTPVEYSFSAAENGSANVIFFDSEQPLINRLKKARLMTVTVEFDGQGKRQIEFQTAGLQWSHT